MGSNLGNIYDEGDIMINEKMFENTTVKDILKKIISEINNSRSLIIDIIETARTEQENMRKELYELKEKAGKIIEEVDSLDIRDKLMRKKLAHVSREFKAYSENEVKEVYEQTLEVRTQYLLKQNEEKQIVVRRNQLEISLKRSLATIEGAEKAINQIAIAASFLSGDMMSSLEGIEQGEQMMYGIKILEAQENERKRISRDIHDGPAQYIANILMKADLCERIIKVDMEEGLQELQELKDAVRHALKEVRGIIYDLRPMTLDDLGLNKAIEEFVKKARDDSSFEVILKQKPLKDEIEPIIQVAAFRIIQEIMNNVKKHSKAQHVQIQLDYGLKYLRIIVVDDGVGFDVEETLKRVRSQSTSYGLVGIYERVNQLKGTLQIDSKPGRGTSYSVKLPVNREVMIDEASY